MIAGVILSAGEGKRIGSVPKALLNFGDKTFLEIACENLFLAHIKEVYVVLGYHAEMIKKHLPFKKEKILINPAPEMGQLSSLQVALKEMPSEVSAIMVSLVDLPGIKLSTCVKLLMEWEVKRDFIHLPVWHERRGHPVIFPGKFFGDLLSAPLDLGARYVVRTNADYVMSWEVDDPGICMDIDTTEDYELIKKDK